MRKQNIPFRKRVALWRAHEKRCYYCEKPLRFSDLWIDHVLPENLLGDAEKLTKIIQEYELESDFVINDYCNWLPTHWRCNQRKGKTIFERGIARFYLAIAKAKFQKAKEQEQSLLRNLKADKILSTVGIAFEEGLISENEIAAVLQAKTKDEQKSFEPTVITFGLTIERVFESGLLDESAPSDYPGLCDWLEQDLIKQLKSFLSCSFYYPEASARNGETLSVRFAFLQLDFDELDKFSSHWWEILEVANYSEIYGVYAEHLEQIK